MIIYKKKNEKQKKKLVFQDIYICITNVKPLW